MLRLARRPVARALSKTKMETTMTRLSRIALHENIMVAATVAIDAFVFRPRQLIGYDRL
jgi:hypothetical protein